MIVMAMSVIAKSLVAPRSLGCGIFAVEDSFGEGPGSPINASQAFEQLIPMTKLHTPRTRALAVHYNPLERPTCGVFMTSICNHSEEDILHTHRLEPITS